MKNIFIVEIMNLNYTHNMRRRVRLTEGDLHRIVKESIRKIISEIDGDPMGDQNLCIRKVILYIGCIITAAHSLTSTR